WPGHLGADRRTVRAHGGRIVGPEVPRQGGGRGRGPAGRVVTPRARAAARSVLVCVAVALPTTAAACGDDAPAVKLSAEGAQGKQVVDNNSCAACHTTNGDDGTGPT